MPGRVLSIRENPRVTAQPDALAFRPATAADAGRLADVLVEGFESFRAFAPPEWRGADRDEVVEVLAGRLGRPRIWGLVAEDGEQVAGYVTLLPAAESRTPVDDPALAQFWMLFVRAPWWGTGLARRLHGAACEAATALGFTAMRLYTPAGQARARRFYEREGWTAATEPYFDSTFGLTIVEYRRPLP